MPPSHKMEGIEAAHRIRAEHPDVGVVVLSQHADEAYAFALLKNGSEGPDASSQDSSSSPGASRT